MMERVRKKSIIEVLALAAATVLAFAGVIILGCVFPNESVSELRAVDFDLSEVTAMKITSEGATTDLIKKGSTWAIRDDQAYQVDSSVAEKTLSTLCGMRAARKLDTMLDESEYGLDFPLCAIELETAGNRRETISIGDYNHGVGKFYVRTGDGSVYLVESAVIDSISLNALDYAEGTSIDRFSLDTISGISVESAGAAFRLLPYDPASGELYSSAFEWKLEGYDTVPLGVDTNTLYQFVSLVKHIGDEERFDYLSDDRDLNAYGLDVPMMSVTTEYEAVTYEGQRYQDVLTLALGIADDVMYAKFDSSPVIYRLSEDTAASLAYLSAGERFLSTKICAVDPGEITGLAIANGSKRYNIEISRDKAPDGTLAAYYVNGSPVDGAAIEELLAVVTEIECYGLAKDADLTPALEIEVQRSVPGFEEMKMVFSKYNVDFYNVSFDRIDNYLINKNYVSTIENLLKEF